MTYYTPSDPSTTTQPGGWTPPADVLNDSRYGARPADASERMWAIAAHLAAPIAAVVSVGWLTFVGPLVVWLLTKDRSRFARETAAGAFNFAITMTIVTVLGWLACLTVIGIPLGVVMIALGAFGSIVLGIVGAVKVSNGVQFVYPTQTPILH